MRCQEPDKMTITYRWWSHKLYLPHNIHSNRFEHLSTQLFGATYFSLTISSFGIFLKISVSYWYHCSNTKIICHLGLLYDGNAYWVLVHVNFTLSKFWLYLIFPNLIAGWLYHITSSNNFWLYYIIPNASCYCYLQSFLWNLSLVPFCQSQC